MVERSRLGGNSVGERMQSSKRLVSRSYLVGSREMRR